MNEANFDYEKVMREFDLSNMLEEVRRYNYNQYNEVFTKEGRVGSKVALISMISNYLQKLIPTNVKDIATRMVEHITGNYEIGLGEKTFEEMDEQAEGIANVVRYANENDISDLMQEGELAEGIVDGGIAYGIIPSEEKDIQTANQNLSSRPEKVKTFFKNVIHNLLNTNKMISNFIAHVSGLDNDEKSAGFNDNIKGKMFGGVLYALISGAYVGKRHFSPVEASDNMKQIIEEQGILHFSSPANIQSIMQSGTIKTSNFLESDLTAKKSFFFAGVPKMEDLLINIPAYDVMTAIRIRPTEEQMKNLKYRPLNDRAVVNDGAFHFDPEQAEIVHYGLHYDKDKDTIVLKEITPEQAKDFKVSDEVRQAYRFTAKNNSFIDKFKMNAYGMYAEYKHHRRLLQFQEEMKRRGITHYRDVADEDLVAMTDIEEAPITPKKSTEAKRTVFSSLKDRIVQMLGKQTIDVQNETPYIDSTEDKMGREIRQIEENSKAL